MSSQTLSRWSGLAWMLAGLLYVVQALALLVKPQADVFTSPYDYAIEAVFVAALLLTLVALLGMRKAAGKGFFSLVSFFFFLSGTLVLILSAGVNLITGDDLLASVSLVGLGLSVLGAVLFGIAIIRAKTLPIWSVITLMLGLPVSVALGDRYGAGIVLGLAWIVVGVALLTKLRVRVKAAESFAEEKMPSL